MAIVISLTKNQQQALENLLRLQNPDVDLLAILEKITKDKAKASEEVLLSKIEQLNPPVEFDF